MSNLMPEKRLNVKGHLVTKHVKVGGTTSTAAMDLPRPKAAADTSQAFNKAVESVVEAIGQHVDFEVKSQVRRDCERMFEHFSVETLESVSAYGGTSDPDDASANYMANCITLLAESAATQERHIKHLTQMFPILNDELGVEWTSDMVSLSLGLSFYDDYVLSINPETKDLTTDERKPYYRALLAVTVEAQDVERLNDNDRQHGLRKGMPDEPPTTNDVRIIAGDFTPSPILDDPDLTDLVIGNVERLDDILTFIKERRTCNPDLLGSYLNDSHRAIAEGIL